MIALLWALSVLTTALAWAVVWRRADYRPVALLLSYSLVSDVVREALASVLPPMPEALTGPPMTGWMRVAGDVDGALFIGWPAGVAALAVWVFARRRPWGVFVAYALAVAFMVATYPRGEDLRRFYLACELAALCVSLGCFLLWALSPRKSATTPALVTAVILAVEWSFVAGGPYRTNIFTDWISAQSMLFALYGALIVVQGVSIWRSRK